MGLSKSAKTDKLPASVPFYYGWVILAVSTLAIFISGPGQTYTFSVFIDPIIQETGWTRTQITGMYAAGSLSGAVFIIGIGRLLDIYGARKVISVVIVLFGLAAFWMSQIDSKLDLYIGFTALRTLGQGAMSLIPTTLVAIWFVRARAKLTSVATLGAAASAAMFPILGHYLISEYGWRNSWLVLGFLIWGLMLLPAVFLVRRSPESIGVLPDGISNDNKFEISNNGGTANLDFTLSQALRTRAFWLLLFAGSSFSLIGTALTFHNIALLGEKGLSANLAASALSVMALSSLCGNIVGGFLNDRFPNKYTLVLAQVILIVAMCITFVITVQWVAFLYAATLGISMGFGMNTITVIWPNYFGRSHLGSIRGPATTSMMAAAALGPLPFSLVHDAAGSFQVAISVFFVLPVICSVAALFAKNPSKDL